MKQIIIVSTVLLITMFSNTMQAQMDGCQLGAWIMQQQPHTLRTPEIVPQLVRHSIVINGTTREVYYPEGFKLEVFAQVPTARGLALSPDGVIYATSYANGGRVYALPDHNHDGVADSTITVATGLGSPHGIGFYNGDLYVSNPTQFYRMVDANHDRVTESSVPLLSFPGGGHTTRNFVFDTSKKKVYIQIGSSSNMGPDTNDSTRATITEANPDGTARRIFARGLRNAVGLDIDPRTGVLWANNNGMDNLFGSGNPKSNDNPSECIYMLCDGANYGWPWAYGFQMRNPTTGFNNIDTSIMQTFSGPVAEVLAHEAPLDLHFYRGTALPAIYHNAIFQTYHGSWNRTPPAPPRVTMMWADSDGRNARVTDLINGFQPDSTGFRYGRVVSIIEGADSALYISDDAANCIYRFSWEGAPASLKINEQNLDNQVFSPNTQVPISWTSDKVDSVDIYFTSDGLTWIPVARSGGNTYMWTVPNVETTKGQLKLVAAGDITTSSQMLGTFSITSLGVQQDQKDLGLQEITIYPNPSANATTIHYALASTEDVSIELVDIRGGKMWSIVRKGQPFGEHSYELDLRDVAAGTYTILVSDLRITRTAKLVIIR